jgi:hypothetical protein
MTEQAYDFHGVRLLVHAQRPSVAEAVDARLRHFRSAPASGRHDIAIELTEGRRSTPAVTGRPVYDTPFGPVTYDDATDQLWSDCGGQAWLDVHAGAGLAHLQAPDESWLISHPLLTIALVELLKRRALFALHAAAMATSDGAVVLFPGASGAGKTTLALGLLRQGWGFLADDMVFLNDSTVLGFPDEVDVSDDTVALFPEIAPGLHRPPAGNRAKRPLLVEDAFDTCPVRRGRPAAIVLPEVGAGDVSRLAPIGPDEALVALAPNVLLTDHAASQAHLDALGALVRSVPCFRLETGRDFRYLGGWLEKIVAGEPIRRSLILP